MFYFLIKWINEATTKRLQKMNRKKELQKIIRRIKNNQGSYKEVDGEKGYAIIIQYEKEDKSILPSIEEILVVTRQDIISSKEEKRNQGGFVIKEIKFDDYLNKDEFINLVNSQTMGKRRYKN